MQFAGGMAREGLFLALVLGVLLVAGTAQAQIYGPKLLIQEEVAADYWPNGTTKDGTLSRIGAMKVGVPNNDDVLQYLRVTLDSGYDTNTNIENETVYQDVLASQPSDYDWELIYVNTSAAVGGSEAAETSYTVTDEAPTLNFTLEYKNSLGGIDLYDDANIEQGHNVYYLNVSITNEHATKSISNAVVNIWFDKNTGPGNAEVHVISNPPPADVGTATRVDSDSDGYYDRVYWIGTLAGAQTANITIQLNISENTHWTGDDLNLDADGDSGDFVADKGGVSNWSSTGALFSGITVSDKFSRGPVRQGVDLSSTAGTWYVRGFIRNMGDAADSGQNLTYNVSEWRIYDVNSATGAPNNILQYGGFNETASAYDIDPSDGRVYTTDATRSSNKSLYDTGSGTKPYMAVYFEWEVIWNSSNSENNISYINTTLDLPTLRLLDLVALQGSPSGTVSPEVGGENVTLNYTLYNVGANETEPGYVEILAYVPNNTTNDNFRNEGAETYSWLIHDDIQIWLNTSGNSYRLDNDTSNCVVTITPTAEDQEGVVNLSVNDLASCTFYGSGPPVGHTLDEGYDIMISFKVESNNGMQTGDQYTFWGIGQLNSSSNTKDSEYFTNQTVSVAGKRLTGYKDLIGYDATMPTMINSTIKVEVQDTSGTGITGIKFIDYVPANTISYENYRGNASVFFYNGVSESGWTIHTPNEYEITDNGTAKTPDGLNVQMFEFVNYTAAANTTWNLSNNQYIRVSYQINFTTAGLYVLPVTIAAFDPDTGLDLGATFYGIIKIVLPDPALPLVIEQGELEQSKTVLVGKPVIWNKEFDIFNPNARTVNTRFQTIVFDDATDGYVSYYDENGRRVEEPVGFGTGPDGEKTMYWDTALAPLENRNYEVTVLTPPVLEIDRDVEVLEQLPEKKVRLKMDVYLKSFAQEDYENVILNLPIAYSKIEEVRDGFGNRIPFTGGADTTSITVNRMAADELKTVTIIYVESYPTIIITPDRDRYNLNSPVSLEILVINGGEEIDYPFLEIEIYTPGMDVIFTDISKLESMKPLEKTQTYQRFVIPAAAPSGNYIAQAKFREDFAVLASATGNFYVTGVGGGIPGAVEVVMIILVLAVLGYFSLRRLREVRKSSSPYGRPLG